MYKKVNLFIFLLAVLQLSAQPRRTKVNLGPEMKYSSFTHFREFLGDDDEHLYTKGTKGDDFYVRKFRKANFAKVYETLIKNSPEKRTAYIGHELVNGEFFIYYTQFDKKARKKYLLVRKLDTRGRLSPLKVISSAQSDKRGAGAFNERMSANGRWLGVMKIPAEYKTSNRSFGLTLFDADHKLIWESDYELPYPRGRFWVTRYSVSDEGEIFALAKSHNGEKSGESSYRENLYVIKLGPDGAYDVVDLSVEDRKVGNLRFRVDVPGGRVGLYGIYNVDHEHDDQGGLLAAVISKTSFKLEHRRFLPFDETVKRSLTREERLDNKPREFFSFSITGIEPRPDGKGMIVMAEKQYKDVLVMEYQYASGSASDYYDKDVLVVSLDENSTPVYSHLIPKIQFSESGKDTYSKSSSIMALDDVGSVHILFNDNPRNKNFKPGGKDPEVMDDPERSVLVHYTISSSGEGQYDVLQQNSKNFLPEVRRFWRCSKPGELLVIGQSGRKDMKLGTIRF